MLGGTKLNRHRCDLFGITCGDKALKSTTLANNCVSVKVTNCSLSVGLILEVLLDHMQGHTQALSLGRDLVHVEEKHHVNKLLTGICL